MIYLAPTLAASRYLDKTEQWSTLPPETKDHAVDLIQKGARHRASRHGAGRRQLEAGGGPACWREQEGAPVGIGERGPGHLWWGVSVTSAAASCPQGYMRIQQFRKTNGSYGAWLHRDSSTW